MQAALHPDVIFRSPMVFKPYEGRDAVMVLLRAVAQVFEDFRYVAELAGTGEYDHALVFEARVGDRQLQGCDFIRTGEDGLITALTVMVRPGSGLMALGGAMSELLAPTP